MRMKRRNSPVLITFLAISLFVAVPAQAAETNTNSNINTNTLTIQDALSQALKDNPDLRTATLAVEKAEIQKDKTSEKVYYTLSSGMATMQYQQTINNYQQADIGYNSAKKALDTEKEKITCDIVAAYTNALKSQNSRQIAYLTLQDMKEQKRVTSLMKVVGLVSEYDYEKLLTNIQQAEQGYTSNESQYASAIATLRSLLGKTENWEPVLTSKPVITTYKRDLLSVALSRGTSESVQVYRAKASLDIEKSKETWVLENVPSDIQKIDLGMAETGYVQAQRSVKAIIEQHYFSIDRLEAQINAGQVVYDRAQKELKIAQLKFDLGLIPKTSSSAGITSVSSAKLETEKARVNLENAKSDLANEKAQFAYLIGQTTFNSEDWQ